MQNTHDGHRERMRKRFFKTKGLDFAPHELLEMLLFYTIPRANTNEIAHHLMQNFDSLPEMFNHCNYEDFIAVKGIGEKSATMLAIIAAIFRSGEKKINKKIFLKKSEQRCNFCVEQINSMACHEEVILAICLSEKMQVIRCEIMDSGTAGSVKINPAKLVKFVFRSNCSNLIIVHNHLTDSAQPSYEDIIETKKLYDFLSMTEINLLDHIIVAGDKVYSMAENHNF